MSENEAKTATAKAAKTTTKTATPRKKRVVDPAIAAIMQEAKRKVWAIKIVSGLDSDQCSSLQSALDSRVSELNATPAQ